MVAQRTLRHGAHDLISKAAKQQATSLGHRDATCLHIKQLLGIHIADGGTMAALHVVGQDFQLGLGIDLRPVGQQQGATQLLRVGLLRQRRNTDAALEYRMAMIVNHVLEQLVAAAVGHGMVQEQRVIEMRGAVRQHQTLDIGLRRAADKLDMQFVARQRRTALHRDMGIARASTDRHATKGGVIGRVMLGLQSDMGELGARADGDMGIDIGPARSSRTTVAITFQYGGFGLGTKADQVTQVDQRRYAEADDLDRLFQHHAVFQQQHDAIAGQRRIQLAERHIPLVAGRSQHILNRLTGGTQRRQCDARGQAADLRGGSIEAAVDENQPVAVGIQGDGLQPGRIDAAVIGGQSPLLALQRVQASEFPAFQLVVRQTKTLKRLDGGLAPRRDDGVLRTWQAGGGSFIGAGQMFSEGQSGHDQLPYAASATISA